MAPPEFVLASAGRQVTSADHDLDGALRQAGIGRPRRILFSADLDAEGAVALVVRLRALVAAGVADELVVAAPPERVDRIGALLTIALEELAPELDVELVVTTDPERLAHERTVRLEPADAGTRAPDIAVKYASELQWWSDILDDWERWYLGAPLPGGIRAPDPEERVTGHDQRANAAMTFSRLQQEPKYITDLGLHPDAFHGMRVLDVGCGPTPSMLAFRGAELHGIDPLIDGYASVGFPIAAWSEQGYNYHCAPAEEMPFADDAFDAVVSVNAIDHVNDFAATAAEIVRVLRPGGAFRMHVHYHERTVNEPIELNDDVFMKYYGAIPNLRKISESDAKDSGRTRGLPGESYVVWGNGEIADWTR